jgi:hypothetical protein
MDHEQFRHPDDTECEQDTECRSADDRRKPNNPIFATSSIPPMTEAKIRRFPEGTRVASLMLVLGLATAMRATSYDIGSPRRMGPGFFPVCAEN